MAPGQPNLAVWPPAFSWGDAICMIFKIPSNPNYSTILCSFSHEKACLKKISGCYHVHSFPLHWVQFYIPDFGQILSVYSIRGSLFYLIYFLVNFLLFFFLFFQCLSFVFLTLDYLQFCLFEHRKMSSSPIKHVWAVLKTTSNIFLNFLFSSVISPDSCFPDLCLFLSSLILPNSQLLSYGFMLAEYRRTVSCVFSIHLYTFYMRSAFPLQWHYCLLFWLWLILILTDDKHTKALKKKKREERKCEEIYINLLYDFKIPIIVAVVNNVLQ